MLSIIWNDFLYQPLFNVLIWIYNNWTDQSLGWAIVYLTIALRLVLLPLTIASEKNKLKNKELSKELAAIAKEYKNDPVLQKQEIRRVLKQKKVRPWAKVFALGIQLLVLVLLYQVFLQGITGEKLIRTLYDWVDFPGRINTIFFGIDLGRVHDILFSGAVGIILLMQIYTDYKKNNRALTKADLFYFLLFPAASFLVLWILPMAKALFVLTSILFSILVHQFIKILFKPKEVKKEA